MIRIKMTILAFFFLVLHWKQFLSKLPTVVRLNINLFGQKTANGMDNKGYNWNVDFDEKYIIEDTFYVIFIAMGSPDSFTMCHMTSIEEEGFHFENSINNSASEERYPRAVLMI